MKKWLDWNYNPVLFLAVFYYKQAKKIIRCFTDKNYEPKYWVW